MNHLALYVICETICLSFKLLSPSFSENKAFSINNYEDWTCGAYWQQFNAKFLIKICKNQIIDFFEKT